MDVAGHDADLDFVRGNQTRAVGAEQQGFFAASGHFSAHAIAHFEHIFDRNAFGNADGQVQIRFHRLPDGGSGTGRWHVNDGHRGARLMGGFFDRGVDRDVENRLARFFGVHAGDKAVFAVGVFLALLRMKLAGFAGNALGDDTGVFIDIDRHGWVLSAECVT